jgi:chorismate mutase
MLRATITASGNTLADLLDAISEARRRIEEENTSGFDRNDVGEFTFDVEEDD